MKGHRCYFDENEKRFKVEFSQSEAGGYSDEEYWNTDLNNALISVENNNKQLQYFHKCPDCNHYFWLLPQEMDWFTNRKLSMPKRCPKCRKKRKQTP